jgi:hypothetical protein
MRRRVLTILLFLVLGALVDIAVAWGLAVVQSSTVLTKVVGPPALVDDLHWLAYVHRRPGACYIEGRAEMRDRLGDADRPGWSITAKPPAERGVPLGWQVFEYARGWPMLSHYCRWSGPKYGTQDLEWGWRISWLTRYQVQQEGNVLPLAIIWPGFAINTIFYAIVLWLLIPGPFVLRRLIRVKRGRCPKCGYDLRGQPAEVGAAGCPECGWKRETEATA